MNTWDKYYEEYDELLKIANEIKPFYDIDKVKPYSVYIWTKGEDGNNVFDIMENELYFYDENHKVNEQSLPIIDKIKSKIKELRLLSESIK